MEKLKLTDVERLLLANQYDILAVLKSDDSYRRMADNLRGGHKWIYDQQAQIISENLPDETAEYVLTILGIYSDLRDSYAKLVDNSGIEENAVIFPGFDGNTESELLHFARALSEHGSFTQTIGKDAKNSHMSTTAMYERMIAEWELLGKPRFPLSKDQVFRITQARIHPKNR